MFYKLENDEILEAPMVTMPDCILVDVDKDSYDYPVQGWYWFDTLEQAQVLLNPHSPHDLLMADLVAFAAQKDIDIVEIAMLLNSENAQWKAEAEYFQNMYLQSWEAFYAGEPLPVLTWE
jgi:hypothetical protein